MKRTDFLRFIPDKTYIKLKYFISFHKRINLENPQTFNEKLNWLKLYNRKDIYTNMVDKYLAKEYAANIIGEEYIIPTIGVYEKFDEIDFDKLPNQFVIKTNHDCGGVVICKDKSKFDIKGARKKIIKHLKSNYFYDNREWPYKNVKPKILIEEYKEDSKSKYLMDYKFFCFNGVVKYMYVATDRDIHQTKFTFFDMNFNVLNIKQHYPNDLRIIDKPKNFEKMKELASKLSAGIPHLRVDFYEINGKVFLGELTFSHMGGFVPFEPEEWDYKFGKLIDLKEIK